MPAANVRVVARFRPLNGREKALIESGADDRGFSITYTLCLCPFVDNCVVVPTLSLT